ncbi:hypothetical protein QO189_06565 [Psychrobacter sp. Arc29]
MGIKKDVDDSAKQIGHTSTIDVPKRSFTFAYSRLQSEAKV